MPDWTIAFVKLMQHKEFTSDEEMMQVAVDLSKHNVIEKTGGPFGCAIFETDKITGKSKLFSVGTNRVTALNNSTRKSFFYGKKVNVNEMVGTALTFKRGISYFAFSS